MYLSSLKIKNVRCFDDNEQMLLKKDAIKIRLEVGGGGAIMATMYKKQCRF